MENNKLNWKTIFTIAGSILAFAIGSGFATGQEVLQFFASYGFWGLAGALVFFILHMYLQIDFITTGQREQFDKGSDIFQYYCGKVIGTFFDYFTVVFVFLSYIVMIAGAGATINQHYGLSTTVGAIIIAVLACITVILGLEKLVNILGFIGPVIIITTIIISISGIFTGTTGIIEGNAILPELEVMQASKNWFMSACSYVGFGLLWFAGFLAALGKTIPSKKEATLGVSFGVTGLALAVVFLVLGLLANIEQVAGSQIPLLYLAENIHPLFSNFMSVVIVLGIYTTAVPLLWTVSSRFTVEKSKSFIITTAVLAAVGCFIGLTMPFDKLVSIIYVINGYAGFLLIAFIIIKNIQRRKEVKQS